MCEVIGFTSRENKLFAAHRSNGAFALALCFVVTQLHSIAARVFDTDAIMYFVK